MGLRWKFLIGIFVILLVTSCGNNQPFTWPATVAGYENFSADQKSAVASALNKLNLNENEVMISTSTAANNSYPIYFRLSSPETATENRAGLATVASDRCTIDLSTEVFTAERKGYVEPVVWHELGHCAGLIHVSGDTEIMYYSTQPMAYYADDALTRYFSSIKSAAGF